MQWRDSILNNKEEIAKIITLEAVGYFTIQSFFYFKTETKTKRD